MGDGQGVVRFHINWDLAPVLHFEFEEDHHLTEAARPGFAGFSLDTWQIHGDVLMKVGPLLIARKPVHFFAAQFPDPEGSGFDYDPQAAAIYYGADFIGKMLAVTQGAPPMYALSPSWKLAL